MDSIAYNADLQKDSMVMFMESLTPKKIVEHLDKYIIGQKDAKRAIAVGIRNRYRRLKLPVELRESITPKNLMMIGPTGVGKTEIARRIARLIGAPFIKVEATKYTEIGYVGRDVESMVRDLMAASLSIVRKETTNTHKERLVNMVNERILACIIPLKEQWNIANLSDNEVRVRLENGVFDNKEIDIETSPANPLGDMFQGMGIIGIESSIPPDLNKMFAKQKKRKRVKIHKAREIFHQEEIEKMTNDDQITETARWRAEQLGIIFIDEFDKIATHSHGKGGESISREGVQRDILPIVEGSQVQTRYGIIDTANVLFVAAGAFHVTKPSDLIPELQGRFPVRVDLKELTVDDFVQILSTTENSLQSQYANLLSTEALHVQIDDEAIKYIANVAYVMNSETDNIGARRLYTVMEKLFEDIMFDAPHITDKNVFIDIPYVKEHLGDVSSPQDYRNYIL